MQPPAAAGRKNLWAAGFTAIQRRVPSIPIQTQQETCAEDAADGSPGLQTHTSNMPAADRQPEPSTADLALFGGSPAFAEPAHVGRPNLLHTERFEERLRGALERGWLTNQGPLVTEFERALAARLDTAECVAVCNATIALALLVRGLDLSGEVILPAFTFVAGPHALWWQRIRPVFCDIDPRTHCLDPEAVEALVTPQTSGILGVHVWGNACDVPALAEIAARHDLALVFDAAHALGCRAHGRPIGGFGRAEVFSLHATKCVHAFEGGVIATDDRELAVRLRLMQNFGFAGEDRVDYIGINGKMSEVSAAMGLTSLESLDEIVGCNRRNHELYARGLGAVPGVELRPAPAEDHNHHYVVAEVDAGRTGLTRDELVAALRLENVVARRYFTPGCHRMEPYRSLLPAPPGLPVTEAVCERVLVLPTGLAMGPDDVQRLCARLALIVDHAAAVRARLATSEDPRLPDFWRDRRKARRG